MFKDCIALLKIIIPSKEDKSTHSENKNKIEEKENDIYYFDNGQFFNNNLYNYTIDDEVFSSFSDFTQNKSADDTNLSTVKEINKNLDLKKN